MRKVDEWLGQNEEQLFEAERKQLKIENPKIRSCQLNKHKNEYISGLRAACEEKMKLKSARVNTKLREKLDGTLKSGTNIDSQLTYVEAKINNNLCYFKD